MAFSCLDTAIPQHRRPREGERRKRTIFTKQQLVVLKLVYSKCPYPDFHVREHLAQKLGLLESRIHVWFQNRRAREPRRRALQNQQNRGVAVAASVCHPDSASPTHPRGNFSSNSRNLGNPSHHDAHLDALSSTLATGLTFPPPQRDSGWDAAQGSLQSPWEGAQNLQQGMNYWGTGQMSWSHQQPGEEDNASSFHSPGGNGWFDGTEYNIPALQDQYAYPNGLENVPQ